MAVISKPVNLEVAAKRTAARWLFVAPTLFLLVVVNQLEKTNVAVIMADRRFLSDMALAGQSARIGLISTMFFFGYGIGLLAWGFVVDRLGPRRTAMLGVCGWALTTIWCAVSHSVNELYAARLVLGIAEGCIWPVCNAYSRRWFPLREQNRIQSTWVNGNQVGIALGLPLVAALISAGGWRTVFWVLGVGSFLLLEPMLLLLAPDTPAASRFANEEEQRHIMSRLAGKREAVYAERSVGLGPLLKDFHFWMVTICHVGTVATLFGLATWIPTYLTQFRGLPFSALGGWVAWTYWIPVPLAILAGYFADRSMRPALVGSATGAVVGVLVLTAVLVPSTVASVLLLATTLASPVIYGALNASIMQRMALPDQIGRATGIFVGLSNLVGGLSPTVIGYLIGHFGGRYLAAFGFISAVNFMLVFLYLPLDRIAKPRTA